MTPTLSNGQPQNPPPATQAELPSSTVADGPTRSLSPRDVLGQSARRDLLVASLVAGLGFAVLFAGLTFGPYYREKWQTATIANTPAPAEKPDTPAVEKPPVAPAPSVPDPGTSKLPPVVGKPPAKGDILDKLGENGTKTSPTRVNPLDKKDDDILKDIK